MGTFTTPDGYGTSQREIWETFIDDEKPIKIDSISCTMLGTSQISYSGIGLCKIEHAPLMDGFVISPEGEPFTLANGDVYSGATNSGMIIFEPEQTIKDILSRKGRFFLYLQSNNGFSGIRFISVVLLQ